MHLVIETSTDLLVLGLFTEQGELIGSQLFSHANNLSKSLLPGIHALLQENGLIPSQLVSIALGIGPGSYTGTRVGAAVAKSLAFSLGIPVKGFPSPLAFIPPSVTGSFSFLMIARAGPIFVLTGRCEEGSLEVDPYCFVEKAELASYTQSATCITFSPSDFPFPTLLAKPNLEPLPSVLLGQSLSVDEGPDLLYLNTPLKNISSIS